MKSVNYYQQLYNTINELETKGLKPSYTVYPSTINYKRKSKFIKSNSNTNKLHRKV